MTEGVIIALVGVGSVVLGNAITKAGEFALYKAKRKDEQTDEETETQKTIKKGILVLLHDRLYQDCKKYVSEGAIDTDGLNNVTAMYEVYHDGLKGNGTGTLLYEKVKALPLITDGTTDGN